MKNLAVFLLFGLLIFNISCGGGGDSATTETTNTGSTTTETTTTETTATGTLTDGSLKIVVDTSQGGHTEFGVTPKNGFTEYRNVNFILSNETAAQVFLTGTTKLKITGTSAAYFKTETNKGLEGLDSLSAKDSATGSTASFTVVFDFSDVATVTAGEKAATLEIEYGSAAGTTSHTLKYPISGKINSWKFLGGKYVKVPGGTEFESTEHIRTGYGREDLQLDVHNGVPYIAYKENTGKAISVMKFNSTSSSWEYVGTQGAVTSDNGTDTTKWPALFVYDDNGTAIPYVAFAEWSNNGTVDDGRTTVMKYSSSTWSVVGSREFTWNDYVAPANPGENHQNYGNGTEMTSLFVYNKSGSAVPYIGVQQKLGANCTTTAYKYTGVGDGWDVLGVTGLLAGATKASSASAIKTFVYNDNGTCVPYLANAGLGMVYKFNGTIWEKIGELGGRIYDIFVANGVPYVVLSTEKGIVKKYVSGSWTTVGAADFTSLTDGDISSIAMDVYVDGTTVIPYVVISESNTTKTQLAVLKYDGTSWTVVGERDITNESEGFYQLRIKICKINNNPVPFVAGMRDTETVAGSPKGKIIVLKYDE